jgi:hypothetical protein
MGKCTKIRQNRNIYHSQFQNDTDKIQLRTYICTFSSVLKVLKEKHFTVWYPLSKILKCSENRKLFRSPRCHEVVSRRLSENSSTMCRFHCTADTYLQSRPYFLRLAPSTSNVPPCDDDVCVDDVCVDVPFSHPPSS